MAIDQHALKRVSKGELQDAAWFRQHVGCFKGTGHAGM